MTDKTNDKGIHNIKRIPGIKHYASVPSGEAVVSMVVHKGVVFVATCTNIYTLENGELKPVDIKPSV